MATFLLKPADGDTTAIDEASRVSSAAARAGAGGTTEPGEAQRTAMEAYQRVQLTRRQSGAGQHNLLSASGLDHRRASMVRETDRLPVYSETVATITSKKDFVVFSKKIMENIVIIAPKMKNVGVRSFMGLQAWLQLSLLS